MFADVMEKLDRVEPLLKYVSDKDFVQGVHFLADRIGHPDSYVTFLGETSSGKSSIVNGLLGECILPVKASPTTGAITEVELSKERVEDYYAINKDATFQKIDRNTFIDLSLKADENLKRVKLKKYHPDFSMSNMRIFDTPGYGSIMAEHEEILKDFLPNSDVVIYTVSYKIGIQEEDYSFLGFLRELVRDDAEIVLAVNMCPESVGKKDKRVEEILRYIEGALGKRPKFFLVPLMHSYDGCEYPLPKAVDLWNYVVSVVNGEKHRKCLHDFFEEVVKGVYSKCDSEIYLKYTQLCLEENDRKAIKKDMEKSAGKIRSAISKFVRPDFKKMRDRLPELFDRAADKVFNHIEEKIDGAGFTKKNEMITFVNAHCLPFSVAKENEEIQSYLRVGLEELNRKVDDYINKEIRDFSSKVEIRLSGYMDKAIKGVSGKIITQGMTNILKDVFKNFGGAGGANAGIANAASSLLKKIGNIFGKTFSRETHNALKRFLAKIGATSMRAVSAGITVLVELIFITCDYVTWKGKLKNKAREGVKNWKEEALKGALKDLKKLEKVNIKNISDIADDFEKSFSDERLLDGENDIDELRRAISLSDTIGKEIGVNAQ